MHAQQGSYKRARGGEIGGSSKNWAAQASRACNNGQGCGQCNAALANGEAAGFAAFYTANKQGRRKKPQNIHLILSWRVEVGLGLNLHMQVYLHVYRCTHAHETVAKRQMQAYLSINGIYTGSFGHADDLRGVVPSLTCANKQARIVEAFTLENSLKLNLDKLEILPMYEGSNISPGNEQLLVGSLSTYHSIH